MTRNVASDFPAAPRASLDAGVSSIVLATFSLGFTEACLQIQRRPIPLRFALRFASANILPSTVWSSIPAADVALASNVPLSALVQSAQQDAARSVSLGRRLVLIRSVRALRCIVGSYGLAWSVWRLCSREKEEQETVVRMAPEHSQLSSASTKQHGQHVVMMEPWEKIDVDWEKMGIDVEAEAGSERVRVVELELEEATVGYARRLSANAARANASVLSVAVLPMSGPPLPTSIADSFDVCFNPSAAVLTYIAEVCHTRGVDHAVLIDAGSERGGDSSNTQLSTAQLAAGLLYRHGIAASVLNAEVEDVVERELLPGLVFFVSGTLQAGLASSDKLIEQGLATTAGVCFVVEESLNGRKLPSDAIQAQSLLLETTTSAQVEKEEADTPQGPGEGEEVSIATHFSVADVSDQTLQGIRTLLRRGTAPSAIQAAVYRAYGTQRVVAPRVDQFSNMNV